jgi:hypothetical protein
VLSENDLIQLPYFVRVVDYAITTDTYNCKLVSHGGIKVSVSRNLLTENAITLDTSEVAELTMSKLADKFVSIPPHMLMQVEFEKANGELRILRGYRLNNSGNSLGQTMCVDLDIETCDNVRLVTHSRIKAINYAGTRYEIKS